jgi:hypothetical protein
MPTGRHAFGDAVIEKVYLVPTRGTPRNGITVQPIMSSLP